MSEKKTGTITKAVGRKPSPVELEVADILARLGYDVEFLPEVRTKGVKNPDISMGGVVWEIKSPIGGSKWTIADNIKNALKQSKSVILDLRRYKGKTSTVILELQSNKVLTKGVQRLKVITSGVEVLDIIPR